MRNIFCSFSIQTICGSTLKRLATGLASYASIFSVTPTRTSTHTWKPVRPRHQRPRRVLRRRHRATICKCSPSCPPSGTLATSMCASCWMVRTAPPPRHSSTRNMPSWSARASEWRRSLPCWAVCWRSFASCRNCTVQPGQCRASRISQIAPTCASTIAHWSCGSWTLFGCRASRRTFSGSSTCWKDGRSSSSPYRATRSLWTANFTLLLCLTWVPSQFLHSSLQFTTVSPLFKRFFYLFNCKCEFTGLDWTGMPMTPIFVIVKCQDVVLFFLVLQAKDCKVAGLSLGMNLHLEVNKKDIITGLRTATKSGRPNWPAVFAKIDQTQKGAVRVFYCGPHALERQLRLLSGQHKFRFSWENF